MGSAASTAREELGAAAGAGVSDAPLTCRLSPEEIAAFADKSNFSQDEVVALFVHYDLISSVKRDDGLIDRSEFQMALGFTAKESLYVDRIFQLFDANGDSFISFPEFLQSVSVLSAKGSTDEKIRFSFDILDLDRDGKISRAELLSMLEACVQEHALLIPESCLHAIVDRTMTEVDTDRDGLISLDEYRALSLANLHMLSHVTLNISGLIAEYMPALRAVAARQTANSSTGS